MAVSIKSSASAKKIAQESPKLTVISRVIKGDTFMVMNSAGFEPDDEFVNLYASQAGESSKLALAPPFNPKVLRHLVFHNNVLNQCVAAMEVNIDGTGHEFIPADEKKEIDPKELEAAKNFFEEPYPGQSFIAQRRALRRDIASIGYGYLEVLRNAQLEIVGTRYIDASTVRLVKLGDPITVKRKVMRNGQEVELILEERPRRYMQLVAGVQRRYFREFGTPRMLNRNTGDWMDPAKEDINLMASDLIPFTAEKDLNTAYSVPCWINQLPSVIGSRKAEEQNLEFFDAGGMPPALIFIEGGAAATSSADTLRSYLSTGNKTRGRAAVVELASTSGDLNSSGKVTVKVERFGAERANDSMYQGYDTKAEEHVRVGFRLPPLFIGRASDYNYATAVVAYQVAEAQVFQPERTEFDEIIHKTIIREMGWKTLKFRSLPITLKSIDEAFAGLALLDGKVDKEKFVGEVNKLIGTDLPYDPEAAPPPPVIQAPPGQEGEEPPAKPPKAPNPPPNTKAPTKKLSTLEAIQLARKVAEASGLVQPQLDLTDSDKKQSLKKAEALDGEDKELFDMVLQSCLQSWNADCGHDH